MLSVHVCSVIELLKHNIPAAVWEGNLLSDVGMKTAHVCCCSHRSVNACLAPLYSVEGMHVVTVEGIGNSRTGLHPVQERLAKAHGSQCGFCTPGFVMSMYALLRSHGGGGPSEEEIEENLAGNLCRCTGYRPILDAFRVFAKSDAHAYSKDSVEAAGGKLGGGGGGGGGICPSTGKPCDCGAQGGGDKRRKLMGEAARLGGVWKKMGRINQAGAARWWGLPKSRWPLQKSSSPRN